MHNGNGRCVKKLQPRWKLYCWQKKNKDTIRKPPARCSGKRSGFIVFFFVLTQQWITVIIAKIGDYWWFLDFHGQICPTLLECPNSYMIQMIALKESYYTLLTSAERKYQKYVIFFFGGTFFFILDIPIKTSKEMRLKWKVSVFCLIVT